MWGLDSKAHEAFEQVRIFMGLVNQQYAPISLVGITNVDETHM